MQKLYEPKIPYFLANDLVAIDVCFPLEAVVKKGRHRVVRMQSGMRVATSRTPTEDEYIDGEGNLFRVYETEDVPHLVAPMPPPTIVGRRMNSRKT